MAFNVKDILKMEVAPALGCTEPVAVALSAAAAASLVAPVEDGGRKSFSALEVWVDPNIYKNGFAVANPWRQRNPGSRAT